MSDYTYCKVPARVRKSDLLILNSYETGKANADPVRDGDRTIEPVSMILGGFEGSPVGDGVWEGHIVFREIQVRDAEVDTVVVADLPGVAPPAEPDVADQDDDPLEAD